MNWQSYWRNYWQSYQRRLMLMFCVISIHWGRGVRMVLVCLVYIRGQKGSARIMYIYFYLVYIRDRKGSARIIYICNVWYTFGVRRGVLEWYTLILIWYTFGVGRRMLEWYTYVLLGIHSGSEGEYSNDICMFCMGYIRGRKESARMIYSRKYDWMISVYHYM